MKMIPACLLFGLLILGPQVLHAADDDFHTPEAVQAARDFSIDGLKLGMTPKEVRTVGTKLTRDPEFDCPEAKLVAYKVEVPKGPDYLVLFFFDGKLYKMNVGYLAETLKEIGSWRTIYHRMVADLGTSQEPEESVATSHQANWQFYKLERHFYFDSSSDTVFLTATDKVAAREVARLRKTKPTGTSDPVQSAVGDTHTPEANQAALDFSISGIKLGMTPEEVTALGAQLKPDADGNLPAVKLAGYSINHFSGLDYLGLSFFEGKLYSMSVAYEPSTLEKIGGWSTIYHRLVTKLGPPQEPEETAEAKKAARWMFLKVDRSFDIVMSKDTALVVVTDLAAAIKLAGQKEAAANVGF